MDALGARVAQPWHDKANATFTTVVDQKNMLASAFGFKLVPNGLLIDPNGVLRFKQIGGFDIKKDEARQQVESFIQQTRANGASETAQAPETLHEPTPDQGDRWEAHFAKAVQLMDAGDNTAAAKALRRALVLDPNNFLVRKQLWRALNPDKFGEQIDFGWQKAQMERESTLGYEQANPIEE